MPLSETENQIDHNGSGNLQAAVVRRSYTVGAANLLWSRRRAIGLWLLIGLAISAALGFRIGKYEATTQLMPPDSSSSSGMAGLAPLLAKVSGASGFAGDLMGGGDLLGGSKNTGALFSKVLASRTITENLVNHFDLCKHYGFKYVEDARKKLTARTVVAEDKKSGVLEITVTDKDPKLATALAFAYIDELDRVMAQVATSSARRERIFLEQRLADEHKVLQESEEQFSKFASSNMALDIPQQTRVSVEAAARLQGALIDAKGQLDAAQLVYSPDNIRIKSLRARVGEIEHELAKLNSGGTAGGSPQDPSSPYPSVKNLPLLGVKWADLYRDTKIHETVFELLTQRYEMSRIQEAKEIPTVKVLDPPSVSEHKQPTIGLVMFLGGLVSVILASAGILMKDGWAQWDENDPWRVLLATIYGTTRKGIRSIVGLGRSGRRDGQTS
jgi:capsule polysaccharide export protein KpsE/RkpR